MFLQQKRIHKRLIQAIHGLLCVVAEVRST